MYRSYSQETENLGVGGGSDRNSTTLPQPSTSSGGKAEGLAYHLLVFCCFTEMNVLSP